MRWRVGEERGVAEPTEWVEFSASPDSIQTEFRLHLFDFQDLGIAPIDVAEGQIFEIEAKNPTYNQFCYIYSGYEGNYSTIPTQEYDFNTIYSNLNQNSTDSDWGFFPGLLYVHA